MAHTQLSHKKSPAKTPGFWGLSGWSHRVLTRHLLLAKSNQRLGLLAALAVVLCTACGSGVRATGEQSCNGSPALCSRPLNEVIFPGTHNSFAASDEPGWYFANQTYPIARQLKDGIRAFLIDIHYGVYDPATGRVRTDLTAEGSDRNKVAAQLPASALRVADRVAGGIGLGTLKGKSEPYLCHTLCELGAEPLDRELGAVATFLRENPDQVLVVIVEDYVPPSTIEQAFDSAGLTRYAETLEPHSPLPTLGELIKRDRRLLVFAEVKGGLTALVHACVLVHPGHAARRAAPWSAQLRPLPGRCRQPDALAEPLDPPVPAEPGPEHADRAGRVSARADLRCARERHISGAIVAVDFYQRTAVVEVARQLNSERREAPG